MGKFLLTGTSDSLRGTILANVMKGIRHGVVYSLVKIQEKTHFTIFSR
jgi:hypothetical protein